MVRLRVADGKGAAIAAAVAVIRDGGVVGYPTDTLYGLAVDPRQDDAVEKLFAAKGRGQAVAIPLIAGTTAQAQEAAELGHLELRLARQFWPGPLSIVAPPRKTISRRVLAGGRTIVVRVPDHPVAAAFAKAFGFCLTSTSANLSGQPGTADPDEVARALGDRIDCLLDGGDAPGGPPSTIVGFVDGAPSLVRAGAIDWDRVLRSLQ
jgi:L-threonylcarbamoyladenylate synthase